MHFIFLGSITGCAYMAIGIDFQSQRRIEGPCFSVEHEAKSSKLSSSHAWRQITFFQGGGGGIKRKDTSTSRIS